MNEMMAAVNLDLRQTLIWTFTAKIFDNLSTFTAIQRHSYLSWENEHNILVSSLGSLLGEGFVVWMTLPIALIAAYLLHRSEYFHTTLEWLLITLLIVPFMNYFQSQAALITFIAWTGFTVTRTVYLDYRLNGPPGLKFWDFDGRKPVKPVLLQFK